MVSGKSLGQHPREGHLRGGGQADRLHTHQLGQAQPHGGFAEAWGERGDEVLFAGGARVEGLEDGERGRVEMENGGRGHQVEEGLAAGFEGVELALGEEGGVGGRGGPRP